MARGAIVTPFLMRTRRINSRAWRCFPKEVRDVGDSFSGCLNFNRGCTSEFISCVGDFSKGGI